MYKRQILGGVRNEIQVYTTGGVYQCRIAPSDQMTTYNVEDENLSGQYFTEKVETKKGWQSIFPVSYTHLDVYKRQT